MVVVEVLLAAVVLFTVAAVATGRGDLMAEVSPDAADDGLSAGRIGPDDVAKARFGLAFRGYRMAEVDAVLDRLAAELRTRDDELAGIRGASSGGGPDAVTSPSRPVAAPEIGLGSGVDDIPPEPRPDDVDLLPEAPASWSGGPDRPRTPATAIRWLRARPATGPISKAVDEPAEDGSQVAERKAGDG